MYHIFLPLQFEFSQLIEKNYNFQTEAEEKRIHFKNNIIKELKK